MTVSATPANGQLAVENGRRSYARIAEVLDVPNLIQVQLRSFEWFIGKPIKGIDGDREATRLKELANDKSGLAELFEEISPIQDFTGSKMELKFEDYGFGEPKYDEDECHDRDMTFSAPLRVTVRLTIRDTGQIVEESLFMGDFPMMTNQGTFIINGAERVVVSQLVRSPGVYFTIQTDASTGRPLAFAKLIPNRGAWLEFDTSNKDILSVKIDRKRKIPVTTLLRALGYETDEEIVALFSEVEADSEHEYIRTTLEKDSAKTVDEALLEFYRRLRPGDPPTVDNAKNLIEQLFFNSRRYDLGRVGRYKLDKRLSSRQGMVQRTLAKEDLVQILRHLIMVNNGKDRPDDIDHLGNRRVRAVGELIQNQFRVGLLRMERVVRERMTITDPETAKPSSLINIRPIVAAMKEFFGGSQLSQFMDQTNPLAELTHKRRLSALGPGGLSRDRAGFDVRDVHFSHYGRICPIETPEGPNIGLIGSLATYAVINDYGFIETPYRKIYKEYLNTDKKLLGRTVREDVVGPRGRTVVAAGTVVGEKDLAKLAKLEEQLVKVKAHVSDDQRDIEYLSADTEDFHVMAQANSLLDENNEFIEEKIEVRFGDKFLMEPPENADYMDVSPKQIVSVATSLIPFLEHDDANRALMGANMQRQAVPLLRAEAPIVGTGIERQVALDSGQVVFSHVDGVIESVTAHEITVRDGSGKSHEHGLVKFVRTNQGTCFNQRPIVDKGQKVKRGQTLADSSSTQNGELALGQNVLCAFMSWEGYNFEDAIIISQRLLQDDKFTSIHIEKHEVEARDTKLGPEEITPDIPNVAEETLRDLDEEGIIRIGAEVGPGDILVGKITPKGETELTAEEKLLRAIFGEKAREVKDTSLRVRHGEWGKVIDVRTFARDAGDELPAGVNHLVRVSIAQRRKIAEGDKMAGRHGNKGVVARILPVEDMPYLPDGRPVDIVLNPIGVPSRMNVGQLLETHLGWAAQALGFHVASPVFDGAREPVIESALARQWLTVRAGQERTGQAGYDPAQEGASADTAEDWVTAKGFDGATAFDPTDETVARTACLTLWAKEVSGQIGLKFKQPKDEKALMALVDRLQLEHRQSAPIYGKTILYDGRTGESFDQAVTVGEIYMLKLIHLVEDKIHARSTGPYSLITQQPLGGKAQFGGQRFGEMEVWALEAYGAAHILQEILTVKSDDVVGRVKTYEAIVKGENIMEPGVPESFKVLVKELQSLGLAVEVLNEDEERITFVEDTSSDVLSELGINLAGFEEG